MTIRGVFQGAGGRGAWWYVFSIYGVNVRIKQNNTIQYSTVHMID